MFTNCNKVAMVVLLSHKMKTHIFNVRASCFSTQIPKGTKRFQQILILQGIKARF